MPTVHGPTGPDHTPGRKRVGEHPKKAAEGVLQGSAGTKAVRPQTGSVGKSIPAQQRGASVEVSERSVTELTALQKGNAIAGEVKNLTQQLRQGKLELDMPQDEFAEIYEKESQIQNIQNSDALKDARGIVAKRRLQATQESNLQGLDKKQSMQRWENEVSKEPEVAQALKLIETSKQTVKYLESIIYLKLAWKKTLATHGGDQQKARAAWREALAQEPLLAHAQETTNTFVGKYKSDSEFQRIADAQLKKPTGQSWFAWGRELISDMMGTLALMNDMEYQDMAGEKDQLEEKGRHLKAQKSVVENNTGLSVEQREAELQKIDQQLQEVAEGIRHLEGATSGLEESAFREQREIMESVISLTGEGVALVQRGAQKGQQAVATVKTGISIAQRAGTILAGTYRLYQEHQQGIQDLVAQAQGAYKKYEQNAGDISAWLQEVSDISGLLEDPEQYIQNEQKIGNLLINAQRLVDSASTFEENEQAILSAVKNAKKLLQSAREQYKSEPSILQSIKLLDDAIDNALKLYENKKPAIQEGLKKAKKFLAEYSKPESQQEVKDQAVKGAVIAKRAGTVIAGTYRLYKEHQEGIQKLIAQAKGAYRKYEENAGEIAKWLQEVSKISGILENPEQIIQNEQAVGKLLINAQQLVDSASTFEENEQAILSAAKEAKALLQSAREQYKSEPSILKSIQSLEDSIDNALKLYETKKPAIQEGLKRAKQFLAEYSKPERQQEVKDQAVESIGQAKETIEQVKAYATALDQWGFFMENLIKSLTGKKATFDLLRYIPEGVKSRIIAAEPKATAVGHYLAVPFVLMGAKNVSNRTGDEAVQDIKKAVRNTKAGVILGAVVPVVTATAIAIGIGIATGGIGLPIALVVIGLLFGATFGPAVGGYMGFRLFRTDKEPEVALDIQAAPPPQEALA